MVNNTMRITGFSSGLDTTQIINDLMKAERAPLDKLFQKREWLEWQRDSYREVNLEISKFKDKADKLRLSTAFNGYKASSSDVSSAMVSVVGNAIPGSYDLEIVKLAESARGKTTNKIQIGSVDAKSTDKVLPAGGTSSITVEIAGGKSASITINETDTFASLASKINSAVDDEGKSLGLRASFDNATSKFIISTKNMGANEKIIIKDNAESGQSNVAMLITNGGTIQDSDGLKATYLNKQGENGKIKFDGETIDDLTSNKVNIYGLELNLLKATPGSVSTINVESDTDAIYNKIKDFVDSYNALIDSLKPQIDTRRNRDYPPLTEEQRESLTEKEAEKWDKKAKQGLLYNDEIIRSTLSNLRIDMSKPVEGMADGQFNLLSKIGISTAYLSTDGKLEIDEKKLRAAIAERPDEVATLFTAEDGVANRVYNEVNNSINRLNEKSGRPNTTPSLDISVIGKSLSELNKQMLSWEDKLKMIENRYWKQFTAMEQAISKMNNQSSSIVNMFN